MKSAQGERKVVGDRMVKKASLVKQGDLSNCGELRRSQSAHSSDEISVMEMERRERRKVDA